MQIGKASSFRHYSFMGSNPITGTNSGYGQIGKGAWFKPKRWYGFESRYPHYGPVDYANRHS